MAFQIKYEEHSTNFGHDRVIWECNTNFGLPTEFKEGEPMNYLKPFEKQDYIKDLYHSGALKLSSKQQMYFKLQRVIVGDHYMPCNPTQGPTLSIVLFTRSFPIRGKTARWSVEYLANQIKLCAIFRYYFPTGNLRIYLDYYLINYLNNISDEYDLKDPVDEKDETRDPVTFTRYCSEFEYGDFEEDKEEASKKYLTKVFQMFKKYEDIKFNNTAERLIFYYHSVCSLIIENGNPTFSSNTFGDIFIYKFGLPFIQNYGTDKEMHQQDSFLGSIIRSLIFIQEGYKYNDTWIERPRFILNRDAHATCITYNDYAIINALYKTSLIKKVRAIFNPASAEYSAVWHNLLPCGDSLVFKSLPQGLLEFCDFTSSKTIFNDLEYLSTIGIAFIIDKNNKPVINNIRLKVTNKNNTIFSGFSYGIDEYLSSSLFTVPSILKDTVFMHEFFKTPDFQHAAFPQTLKKNIAIADIVLAKYIIDTKKYSDGIISIKDFINELEEARNRHFPDHLKNMPENALNSLSLALSIYPTKYKMWISRFWSVRFEQKRELNAKLGMNFFISQRMKFLYEHEVKESKEEMDTIINNFIQSRFEDIDINSLAFNCNTTLLFDSHTWCLQNFIVPEEKQLTTPCKYANYISGFYDVPQPPGISVLRRPEDASHVINQLINNTSKIPLKVGIFKKSVDNHQFATDLLNSQLVNDDGLINLQIKNELFEYPSYTGIFGFFQRMFGGKSATNILERLEAFNVLDKQRLFSTLIWRTMNYKLYDVPVKWLYVSNDYTNQQLLELNTLIFELAEMQDWDKHVITKLLKIPNNNVKTIPNNYFMDKYGGYLFISFNSIILVVVILLIIMIIYYIYNLSKKTVSPNPNLYAHV